MKKLFSLTTMTLLVALSLSAVAAYYSIIGLTAIFAGAVIPIIIMGSILEVGKITTTVWLRKYWKQCGISLKLYLVPAVIALAILTSMGIFGFLSKAHMDTGLSSGDVQAQLMLIDEKIKTEREKIETSRKALQQLDAQVDTRLSRGNSEQGVERAVVIRRQQAAERNKLQKEISTAQQVIATLNEQRAPIAAENRKIEAEVGPIKYVAALIYGDNPDANLLERSVRWLIILLVVVFDPLAIALVLAAHASREWDNAEDKKKEPQIEIKHVPATITEEKEVIKEELKPISDVPEKTEEVVVNESTHPYLYKKGGGFKNLKPMVHKIDPVLPPEPEVSTNIEQIPEVTVKEESIVVPVEQPVSIDEIQEPVEITEKELITSTIAAPQPIDTIESEGDYVVYEGKKVSKNALKEMKPEFFMLTADSATSITTKSGAFGIQFPRMATKGDVFMRVDVIPNKLYKFDGRRWFEVNKDTIDTYLTEDYIKFLINKIDNGTYTIDILSDKEKEQIAFYLSTRT